eukprot:s5672_g3.t1
MYDNDEDEDDDEDDDDDDEGDDDDDDDDDEDDDDDDGEDDTVADDGVEDDDVEDDEVKEDYVEDGELYGAFLKLVLHGQECLEHKGGTLVAAFKGKGSPMEASSYRSLLVSSHIGKVLHRTVRQTQASSLETYMGLQQLGGKRNVPVTLGLREVRAYPRGAQQRSLSVALLMVDLQEAFYHVLRPLAVGCSFTDTKIADMARRLQLGPDALHQLHEHLRAPSAIHQAG